MSERWDENLRPGLYLILLVPAVAISLLTSPLPALGVLPVAALYVVVGGPRRDAGQHRPPRGLLGHLRRCATLYPLAALLAWFCLANWRDPGLWWWGPVTLVPVTTVVGAIVGDAVYLAMVRKQRPRSAPIGPPAG